MSTILSTVEGYEDQVIDFVHKTKSPVVDFVAKGVERFGDRLPSVTYPASMATPLEVVESQARFAKKLIDANTAVVTAVLETVAPVLGYKTKKVVRAAKAA
jgi:hypothetical protein